MTGDPRRLLRQMFDAAIARAMPDECVPRFLLPPPAGRTVVVGAGKAAAAMARAVETHWPRAAALEGLVVTRYGHRVPTERIEVVQAAHPVPDAAGQAAAARILELVEGLTADDLVLCLISGGGSALLSLPAPGLSLEDKQAVSRALLTCGANIAEINCVRKHLSAIKEGRLAVACHPAKVITLAISDVPGDQPSVIASGPTVPDPTTFADALAILARYRIAAPSRVMAHLRAGRQETPKPNDPRLRGVETHVVAAAQESLEAAARVAREGGFTPVILGDSLEGEARQVALVHAAIARQVLRHRQPVAPPCVLLSGGETTVTVVGRGRGGRNVEFLLALALALQGMPGVHAIAGDTDGIDGTEDNAGAIVTPSTLPRASALGLDVPSHLANNDGYEVFARLGDLVMTGPTQYQRQRFPGGVDQRRPRPGASRWGELMGVAAIGHPSGRLMPTPRRADPADRRSGPVERARPPCGARSSGWTTSTVLCTLPHSPTSLAMTSFLGTGGDATMAYLHLRSVSRRGFCFLVAIAALPSCKSVGNPGAEVSGPSRPTTSDGVVVYAGVGRSLRVYALDTRTGGLELRQTVPDLSGDVQYVAVHPTRRWLYVSCTEVPAPKDRPQVSAIYAFGIDAKTGALAQLGQPHTPPLSRAININVDNTGRFLLLAHNITESASVLGLNADGSLGEPVQQPEGLQHLGFLVHQIRIDPSNKWVMVPVRGDDEKVTVDGKGKKVEPEKLGHIVVFDFSDGRLSRRHQVDFPSLLGPRHLDFHPTQPLVYVSMERGNRIMTYRHDNGVLTEVFDTTTLADPSLKFPAQRAGPIHVHPSGKWLYVANRNTQPCSSATPCDKPSGPGENDVAVFSLDPATGEPRLIQHIDTHGFEARTMTIDPTSRFLIVANQKAFSLGSPRQADKVVEVAPNLSVFRIGDDGKLSYLRTVDLTGGEAWWVGAVALP